MDPSHVLWIGGPQGSGKSSIARALAERFGLQLYAIDARVWVHEARLPENEFGSMTMEERWLDATPERMLEWFVDTSALRFQLVLEDLHDLPDRPACIAEGPQFFPSIVLPYLGGADQAVFLLPDVEDMAVRLRARGPIAGMHDGIQARENAIARDLLIAALYEREAGEQGLLVDRPLNGMVELVAERFAAAVARLPRDGDLPAVREFEANVRRTQIRLYKEWLSGAAGTSP